MFLVLSLIPLDPSRRCISEPLRTQISLVDSAMLNYFEADLNISLHFAFLRQFLLMEDGEFSQRLADQLFDRIANSKFGKNRGWR